MTNIWLLATIPLLAWLLARVRRSRLLSMAQTVRSPDVEQVSARELGRFVSEMSSTLEPGSKVLSPNYPPESGHTWESPSGKRVYMN